MDQAGSTCSSGGAHGDSCARGNGEPAGMGTSARITRDAPQCIGAKEVNLGEEAKKTVRAEIYAVEQQYVMKAGRLEIQPYWEFTLNDQFVSHDGPGLALNYYITQVLAIGLNGNFYEGINADSDFNFENRRSARIAVPLNQYQAAGALNFVHYCRPQCTESLALVSGDFIFQLRRLH